MFALQGYQVTATDDSQSAIDRVEQNARVQNVDIATKLCDMSDQGFASESFDIVLAYNVIYHGRRQDFSNAITHVVDLLRPQGIFFFTCPTRRDGKYGEGNRIEPHAYESPNSVTPGDLHYFPDESDFDGLLVAFNVRDIVKMKSIGTIRELSSSTRTGRCWWKSYEFEN